MSLINTSLKIGKTIKSAGRLRTIVGVFVKHGFQNVVVRARLGRFAFRNPATATNEDKYTAAERIRMAFEELGPTFVKLGQLMATRPDLIPNEFVEEFKKLHDNVGPVPFPAIEKMVSESLKKPIKEVFSEFDETPMAAASIAQVHRAKLLDGTAVVVKVQRPGIVRTINEDLTVLYTIAELLQKYVPEIRTINPVSLVDEFFKTLQLETNFLAEANNINRFTRNFTDDPNILIPHVYIEHSSQEVLVLEAMLGIPLSKPAALNQEGVIPNEIIKNGLKAFFKMVYRDGFFHGDLHAGNLFIMPNNRIGLVDFGVVGRLSRRVREGIVGMFLALAQEDYEQLAWEYLELSPHSQFVDQDAFARALRDLLAPYFGLSLKHLNVGRLLMDSASVASKHNLEVPPELLLFFKSIVTVEGMGRLVVDDFDLLSHALDFATEIAKERLDPVRFSKDVLRFSKETTSLVSGLPRQMRTLLRRLTSPDYSKRISIDQMDDLRISIEDASKLFYLGLLSAALILAGTAAFFIENHPNLLGIPVLSWVAFAIAGFFWLLSFRH